MKQEDMELKYKDDSIELWAHKFHPGWDLKVRPAANVVPVTPDGKIVIMSEFKEDQSRSILGFPGGMIEDGESAAEGATREAAEELGLVVKNLVEFSSVRTGFPDTTVTYFLGSIVGKTERKDWEVIDEVREVTLEELYDLAFDGKISDPRQVVAILALKKQLESGELHLPIGS